MCTIRQAQTSELPLDLLLLADPSLERLQEYLSQSQCFVAEVSGHVVGECILVATPDQTLEIVNIAVEESHQHRGVGQRLISRATAYAKSLDYRTLEVGTGNSSLGPLAFYQKCGFRIVGIDYGFFVRHYATPIWENGMACTDRVRLALDLGRVGSCRGTDGL